MKLGGIGHLPYERDAYYREVCDYLSVPSIVTKKDVYNNLGYIALPTVLDMHQSRNTHRIFVGGNRSGKSEGAAWEIVPYLFLETRGWIVCVNYAMAEVIREKIEGILIDRAQCKKASRPQNLREFEFAYEARDHVLTMWTGATLELKSAENPDSMNAVPLDYAVVDEAALFPWPLYDSRLIPRLVDSGGWILSLGTFEYLTGEWLESYYDIGQTENVWDIKSWSHPTSDNYHKYYAIGGETADFLGVKYHINPKKVVKMNDELSWPLNRGDEVYIFNVDLAWLDKEKRRIDPDTFSARYEAIPAQNRYLVFPSWNVVDYASKEADKRSKFDPLLPVYLAIDPGGTYAVAAIQLKKFDDLPNTNEIAHGFHVCIIDEVYFQTTVTTQEVFEECQHREWWSNVSRQNGGWDAFQGAIDVRASEQERAWRNLARKDDVIKSLNLRSRNVNVQDGIKTMQHYLDTHTLWSNPKNHFLHLEFKRYHWAQPNIAHQDTEDPRRSAKPKDSWDHLLKAIWYFLVLKFGCYEQSHAPATVSLAKMKKRSRRERGIRRLDEDYSTGS